jgi:hypothetical protein
MILIDPYGKDMLKQNADAEVDEEQVILVVTDRMPKGRRRAALEIRGMSSKLKSLHHATLTNPMQSIQKVVYLCGYRRSTSFFEKNTSAPILLVKSV